MVRLKCWAAIRFKSWALVRHNVCRRHASFWLPRRWLQGRIRKGTGWFFVSQLVNWLEASRPMANQLRSWTWQEVSSLKA